MPRSASKEPSRYAQPDEDLKERKDKEAATKEMVTKMTEKLKPILALGSFKALLETQDKDPAYYGDVVTPDDADQVLMRWKVSDTEYRVIFGNLHVETVKADVLTELEKTLPAR